MTELQREKVLALIRVHYNLFHSDRILEAIEDEDITKDELLGGIAQIVLAEQNDNFVEPFTIPMF